MKSTKEMKILFILITILIISIIMFSFTTMIIYSGKSNKVIENKYVFSPLSDNSPDRENETYDLILSSEDGPPLTMPDGTGTLSMVVKEAFRRIGINVNIIVLPAERALQNAQNGITDGDYTRIEGLEKYYPNLIMVPEKLVDYEFVAFTKNQDVKLNTWEDLSPYSVGFVTGWKIFEQNIKEAKTITGARDEKLLFALLEKDRIDIITHSKYGGEYLIKEMNLKNIRIIAPPLAIRPMYIYLNKKHSSLILPFISSLRSMKKDGTYNKLLDSF